MQRRACARRRATEPKLLHTLELRCLALKKCQLWRIVRPALSHRTTFPTSGSTIILRSLPTQAYATSFASYAALMPWIGAVIWEIDDSSGGTVDWDEFQLAYRRASADQTGFEPRKVSFTHAVNYMPCSSEFDAYSHDALRFAQLAWLIEFLLMDEHNQGFVTGEFWITSCTVLARLP
eukprot:SAG11_NODE_2228_length_3654_cov_1.962640_4_plen_178_part_00